VTRKTSLPSDEEVRHAKTELLAEAHASGTRPTVVALARRLGLTNPTFWRHFPDTAREIAYLGRTPPATTPTADSTAGRIHELEKRNADLHRANQNLTEHLELAVANIQRLALDNHRLQQELEAAAKVTQLGPRITQRARS
jgi:hypothetical protein